MHLRRGTDVVTLTDPDCRRFGRTVRRLNNRAAVDLEISMLICGTRASDVVTGVPIGGQQNAGGRTCSTGGAVGNGVAVQVERDVIRVDEETRAT